MFKARTRMLILGHRADRMHQERLIAEESDKLRTTLRSIARNRASIHRKIFPILENQKRWTKRLHEEAADLKLQAKIATCERFRRQDSQNIAHLKDLIQTLDSYKDNVREAQEEIEMLQKDVRETEVKLKEVNRQIAERKELLRRFSRPSNDKMARRMDNACKELGVQLKTNRELMAKIHHLVLERAVTQKVHTKLQGELKKMTRCLLGNVGVATDMYEKRDKTRRGTVQLQEHYERGTASFHTEMNTYGLKIDALVNIENFMTTKSKIRFDEFAEKRTTLLKQLSQSQKDVLAYQAEVGKVDRSFDTDGSLMDVVHVFIQMVDENFMLFMNISETREKTHEIETMIDSTSARMKQLLEERKLKYREFRAQKEELTQKISVYRQAFVEQLRLVDCAEELIQKYIQAVKDVLTMMSYTEQDIHRLSGVYRCLEERNILTFMSEIEDFVNKLWDIQSFIDYGQFCDRQKKNMGLGDPATNRPPRTVVKACPSVKTPSFSVEEEYRANQQDETSKWPLALGQVMKLVDDDLRERVYFDAEKKTPSVKSSDNLLDAAPEDSSTDVRAPSINCTDVF